MTTFFLEAPTMLRLIQNGQESRLITLAWLLLSQCDANQIHEMLKIKRLSKVGDARHAITFRPDTFPQPGSAFHPVLPYSCPVRMVRGVGSGACGRRRPWADTLVLLFF